MSITKTDFSSKTVEAHCFTLENESLIVKILDYGAIIQSIYAPDKEGRWEDVVLGFDTLQEYIEDNGKIYHGATIGRNANRIAKGHFELNGKEYSLVINNGPNHLHGGKNGFNAKVFASRIEDEKLILTYTSNDGEEGYPGTLILQVTYYLDGKSLHIVYDAHSDADTLCNITNHAYYNLAGKGDIYDHKLRIAADLFVACDPDCLGLDIRRVENTPFDFREAKTIRSQIFKEDEQLENGRGYDHHFVLNEAKEAVLKDPESGRKMILHTTQNGVQVYTANWFDHENGKKGAVYEARYGIALEAQMMPDAIHREGTPSVLKKDETYHQETILTFEAE